MTNHQKNPVQLLAQIDSVRLTNWFLRTTWKASAGVITLTVRLFTSIILTVLRIAQRRRNSW